MARMHAYPGRTFGQLYHRFFRTNDLADGRLALERRARRPRRRDACRCSRSPARGDGIAPRRGRATTSATLAAERAEVRLETAPGGHLGVLTGRAARGTTWALLDELLDADAPCTAAHAGLHAPPPAERLPSARRCAVSSALASSSSRPSPAAASAAQQPSRPIARRHDAPAGSMSAT